MFKIEEEWKVNYLTESEIAEEYGVYYDWLEEHRRNDKYQFSISKETNSDGVSYGLIVSNAEIRKWADKNYQQFSGIRQNPFDSKFYSTRDLGVLMEFTEEMKRHAV